MLRYWPCDKLKNLPGLGRLADRRGPLFYAECFFDLGNIIQLFPGKEFYFALDLLAIGRNKGLFHDLRFAAHMTISGRLAIDRVAQFETGLDEIGPHIEYLRNLLFDLFVR